MPRLLVALLLAYHSADALQGAALRTTPSASRSKVEMASPPPPPEKGGFGFDLFPPPPPPGAKPPAAKSLFADFQANQASMYGDLSSQVGLAKNQKKAKKAAKKVAATQTVNESEGPDLALVLGAFAVLALAAAASQGGA